MCLELELEPVWTLCFRPPWKFGLVHHVEPWFSFTEGRSPALTDGLCIWSFGYLLDMEQKKSSSELSCPTQDEKVTSVNQREDISQFSAFPGLHLFVTMCFFL